MFHLHFFFAYIYIFKMHFQFYLLNSLSLSKHICIHIKKLKATCFDIIRTFYLQIYHLYKLHMNWFEVVYGYRFSVCVCKYSRERGLTILMENSKVIHIGKNHMKTHTQLNTLFSLGNALKIFSTLTPPRIKCSTILFIYYYTCIFCNP